MTNWTKASIGLATFSFINLVLFITFSTPIGTIFTLIEDQSTEMGIDADVHPIISSLRTVFGLMFVLSGAGLIVWFFLGSHREEFEEY